MCVNFKLYTNPTNGRTKNFHKGSLEASLLAEICTALFNKSEIRKKSKSIRVVCQNINLFVEDGEEKVSTAWNLVEKGVDVSELSEEAKLIAKLLHFAKA